MSFLGHIFQKRLPMLFFDEISEKNPFSQIYSLSFFDGKTAKKGHRKKLNLKKD